MSLFLVAFAGAGQARAAQLSGTSVTITANATDNVGVAGVRFLLDGRQLGVEDTSAPYTLTWNTTASGDGLHTLTAVARDAAGNLGYSPPVVVSVDNSTTSEADTAPPSVQTTSPGDGAFVAGSVAVTATATDDVRVAGVQFLLDGGPLGVEDRIAPYSTTWDTSTAGNGNHVLSARARDAAGNTAVSTVGVTVENSSAEGADDDTGSDSVLGKSVALSIESSSRAGFRTIRAHSDTGDRLDLSIDGQVASGADAPLLLYEWDLRPLIGSHEIRVVATDHSDVVATVSLFYEIGTAQMPSIELEVADLPVVGAAVIEARARVPGGARLELYLGGELRVAKLGDEIRFAWEPQAGPQAILFAVYDAFGVVASASAAYGP